MAAGEQTARSRSRFPRNYVNKELAGREAEFEVNGKVDRGVPAPW